MNDSALAALVHELRTWAITWTVLAVIRWVILNPDRLGGWWWSIQAGYLARDNDDRRAVIRECDAVLAQIRVERAKSEPGSTVRPCTRQEGLR